MHVHPCLLHYGTTADLETTHRVRSRTRPARDVLFALPLSLYDPDVFPEISESSSAWTSQRVLASVIAFKISGRCREDRETSRCS